MDQAKKRKAFCELEARWTQRAPSGDIDKLILAGIRLPQSQAASPTLLIMHLPNRKQRALGSTFDTEVDIHHFQSKQDLITSHSLVRQSL